MGGDYPMVAQKVLPYATLTDPRHAAFAVWLVSAGSPMNTELKE